MIGFAETFAAISAAILLPAIIGILIMWLASRFMDSRYLAAFGVGVFLWFFLDTANDSGQIDVSAGLTGGAQQIALYGLFAVGFLLIVSLDRSVFSGEPVASRASLTIPLLAALAVGVHGFGEAAAYATTASATSSGSLLDAFGGAAAAVAFLLHKTLEPMMVGACYFVYSKAHAVSPAGRLKDAATLAAVFSLPGIIGAAIAYFVSFNAPYAFALGLGTATYAILRLSRPLFVGARGSDSLKVAGLIILGFTCLYLAALLHS
jgi:hypothetical protein